MYCGSGTANRIIARLLAVVVCNSVRRMCTHQMTTSPTSPTSSIFSNRIGMKIGTNVLQVGLNTHDRLTESDFRFDVAHSRWRPQRHFRHKSAAAWWMNTKCPPGARAAAYIRQFLIFSIVTICRYRRADLFLRWDGVYVERHRRRHSLCVRHLSQVCINCWSYLGYKLVPTSIGPGPCNR